MFKFEIKYLHNIWHLTIYTNLKNCKDYSVHSNLFQKTSIRRLFTQERLNNLLSETDNAKPFKLEEVTIVTAETSEMYKCITRMSEITPIAYFTVISSTNFYVVDLLHVTAIV